MKVSFSVGSSSGKLINTLSKSADNVEFMTYSSIPEMIKESTMRHVFFDRIVFSEKIVGNLEEDLRALNSYITEYSANTSIVFICQNNSGSDRVFSEIFDSPLYTPVLISRATANILLELIRDDITSVKTKYCTLDVKSYQGVVSQREVKEEPQVVNTVDEKPAKKGLFKGLFGGKKNKSQKLEIQNPDSKLIQDASNMAESVSKKVEEMAVGSLSEVAAKSVESASYTMGMKNDREESFGFISSVPGSGGSVNFGDEFSSFDEGLGDLGLGDLGEQHVDTGFLDEGLEEEIERELMEDSMRAEEPVKGMDEVFEDRGTVEVEDTKDTYSHIEEPVGGTFEVEEEDSVPSDEEFTFAPIENNEGRFWLDDGKKADDSFGKFESSNRLIIGDRGLGCTSYIVENALDYVKEGKKVLIVDLDYKRNGLLSYIDTAKYYRETYEGNIAEGKVYTEDGVDILSNGYGRFISDEFIGNVISMLGSGKYDIVFIDCPLDCLDSLSVDLIKNCVGLIRVDGNRCIIMSTLDGLTDRGNVSPDIEDALYGVSKFIVMNKISEFAEDVEFIRGNCLFGREDWSAKLV